MIPQLLLAATATGLASAVSNTPSPESILPLPPMGFNNWARYMEDINEAIFVDAAEILSTKGLLKAGYNRLNLDDAWSTKQRAANGSMVWDTAKFPNGLPWLAAHMKSKGFIPGIYTDAGNLSCGGYPGALDHEEIDLKDFKAWGFEYLKMDGCNMPDTSEATYREVYGRWNTLLKNDPNPMVFSDSAPAYFASQPNLTDWYTVMEWSMEFGQLARHSADIIVYPRGVAWDSMMFNYGQQVRLARYQRPGFFNDPDFLNVDHPTYTLDEKKSHFALWCSFSAPLLLSTDLHVLKDEEVEYLTNEHLLAINQDKLIQQATLVSRDGTWDVLTKSVANGDRILTVLNLGTKPGDITVPWSRIGFSGKDVPSKGSVEVTDLWTGKKSQVEVSAGGITAKSVPTHGTAVFRLSTTIGKSQVAVTPTGMIFNTFTLNCLTDDKSGKVSWKKCDASDAQVWKVRADGHVNSLLRPNECLVDAKGKIITRHSGCTTDKWDHFYSGNVINAVSKRCLTEHADGSASADSCDYMSNEQVFGLPVGVKVN